MLLLNLARSQIDVKKIILVIVGKSEKNKLVFVKRSIIHNDIRSLGLEY